MMSLVLSLVFWIGVQAQTVPTCQGNDLVGAADSCMQYYQCIDGAPQLKTCPWGLYWNDVDNGCDWPDKVRCVITQEEAEVLRLPEPTYLYITFDDGPLGGTNETFEVVSDLSIRATWFIVGQTLDGSFPPDSPIFNMNLQRSFHQIVRAGHVIADHTYDHMAHNGEYASGGYYAYLENYTDSAVYFGQMNIDAAMQSLILAGFPPEDQLRVAESMRTMARMPSSNNWRVDHGRIRVDCLECSVPASSSYYSIKLADYLMDNNPDLNIYGWDYMYPTNWTTGQYYKNHLEAVMDLTALSTKERNKIVLLTHDHLHSANSEFGPDNLSNFNEFMKIVKLMGYEFRTMDTYLTDDPLSDE